MTEQEQQQRAKMAAKADRLNRSDIRCYLCNGAFGHKRNKWPTRDHVVPLSDPNFALWRNKRRNVKWAHFKCNQSKANMPVTYYRMMKMFSGTETGRWQLLDVRLNNPSLAKSLEVLR